MDYLGEIIRETGPTALNTKEKVGIYLGNISTQKPTDLVHGG